ncbi:LacI family DNA-binding transcriptional regulator [Streptomyces pinistramenti]|uniref:LacI family DNA-binding transcriptional regulator n=1 Tax=Streptomyces pinistramenti TaxID=2884812 RepID=UPI001D05F9E7|nr:LacI family DNA-binding transcriptional regulator [Streptomyces pinistramenti]MCB5910033.1 LacI family transcriptional regulator [Streptomyces pinistramenti]
MRRVTLADVARAAGVAKATASRALSADNREVGAATRARIQEIAGEMGYRPSRVAQALRTGRFRLIVLAVPAGEPGWAEVLSGAMAEAERRGYHVLVRPIEADGSLPSQDAAELPVDGLVLVGPGRVSWGEERPRPAVVVDEDLIDPDATIVRTANWNAGHQAGRHLMRQGRNSVVVLVPEDGAGGARARAAGCQSAFAEAGRELSADRILPVGADPREAVDAAIGRGLRFDGIFGCTDRITVASLGSLRRAGWRVPEDVAVVCFGDERVAGLADPPLTVIPRPAAGLGARAVQLLARAIEGASEPPEVHELPTRLLVAASSGRHEDESRESAHA